MLAGVFDSESGRLSVRCSLFMSLCALEIPTPSRSLKESPVRGGRLSHAAEEERLPVAYSFCTWGNSCLCLTGTVTRLIDGTCFYGRSRRSGSLSPHVLPVRWHGRACLCVFFRSVLILCGCRATSVPFADNVRKEPLMWGKKSDGETCVFA